MLKLCLKFGIIFVATQLFMNQFVSPAIVSKNDSLATFACFAGLAWMFVVGMIVYRTWIGITPSPEAHPYKDLMDMPDPQQEWAKKQEEKK